MDMDDAFSVGAYIDGGDAYPAQWAARARAFRDQAQFLADLPYGDGARQVFDLFVPPRLPRGTVVFVHGGYWRAFDKSSWSHLAAGPLAAGWAVAMPSYDLCPDVTITQITRQVRRAIGVIAQRVPGPLRLTGHSAGGHLVARMLDPALRKPWHRRVERVVPISALTDLEPLVQTAMNADFMMERETARAESPVHQPRPRVSVTLWVGEKERPVFVEQSRALAQAWGCDCVIAPGQHHFNVIDGLADPDSPLTRAVLA